MIHARKDYDHIQDSTGKIPADEPVFLLRAQDPTAAEAVRYWCHLNQKNPDKAIVEHAARHAREMDSWPVKKTADMPVNSGDGQPS